jgi:site-specific recombinase XerC
MMNNPFASLDLRPLRARKTSSTPRIPNLDRQLNLVDVSKPSGVRDWVILLLRNKYKFLPGEISKLDISDVDLSGGIIYIVRQRKKQIVVIDEHDLFAFQRWIAVRKLYASNQYLRQN